MFSYLFFLLLFVCAARGQSSEMISKEIESRELTKESEEITQSTETEFNQNNEINNTSENIVSESIVTTDEKELVKNSETDLNQDNEIKNTTENIVNTSPAITDEKELVQSSENESNQERKIKNTTENIVNTSPAITDEKESFNTIKFSRLCNDDYFNAIKEFFEYYSVYPVDSTDFSYCRDKIYKICHHIRRDYDDVFNDIINIDVSKTSLNEIIETYNQVRFANLPELAKTKIITDKKSPIKKIGYYKFKSIVLPLWMTADIRKQNLRPLNFSFYKERTQINQYKMLGIQYGKDDMGNILPHSLGGDNLLLNLIPISKSINKYVEKKKLIRPSMYLRSHEYLIHEFLSSYPNGRAVWAMTVHYSQSLDNLRPYGFCLHYVLYRDHDDDDSEYYRSENLCFNNVNENFCLIEKECKRNKRAIDEDYSDISKNLDKMIEKCPFPFIETPRGKIGEQISYGNQKRNFDIALHYVIRGKHYLYGHNLRSTRWAIREIKPNGTIKRKESSYGFWGVSYPAAFIYSINGRRFIYNHNTRGKLWSIRELLADGTIGEETGNNKWMHGYEYAIPFSINGITAFIHQNQKREYIITKLLSHGELGLTIEEKSFPDYYAAAFVYTILGKTFIYGQTRTDFSWSIHEILPNGTIGLETDRGEWDEFYEVNFPFSIKDKHFFYAHNKYKFYFTVELLPNGKISTDKADNGLWDGFYYNSLPFSMNGRQFMYGEKVDHWFIKEIV